MASAELIDSSYKSEKSPASFLEEIEGIEIGKPEIKEENGEKEGERTGRGEEDEIWKEAETQEENENLSLGYRAAYTGIPVLAIAFAELLIYMGSTKEAMWAHTLLLTALALSVGLIGDRKIQNTYQALIILPILRIINLSVPVFVDTTLYAFIFIYAPLTIPITIAATHQKLTREQLGLNFRKLGVYLPFSLLAGLLLASGEYIILQPKTALIPSLSFPNLLELTFVMVFCVALIEELTFRSILQTRLEEFLSPAAGILISSLLFGLMHSGYANPLEIIYTTFVGIFIGQFFYKTRSLPLITLIHGFSNIFLFGVLPLIGPELGLI